jgi:hypothetical protein
MKNMQNEECDDMKEIYFQVKVLTRIVTHTRQISNAWYEDEKALISFV